MSAGSERIRVALVGHGIHDAGGMERASRQLVIELHDRVAFVVVSCELDEDLRPMVDRWVHVGVPQRPIPLKLLCFQAKAGRVVAGLDVDLVHTVGAIIPNRVDLASVHLCQAGFVSRTGHLAPTDAVPIRRINSGLTRAGALLAERWSYRPSRVRALAAVSDGVADELRTHYPDVRREVIYNGVDTVRYAPDAERREALRSAAGLNDDDVVAIFIGGDWNLKGLAIAIKAVGLVRARGIRLRLWVVGNGEVERFGTLADAQGAAGAVRFWGVRRDTEDLLRAADMLVLPSMYESFSLVLLEAASSGLPVVVADLSGGLPRMLTGDGRAGRIVAREPEAFAEALAELASDPGLRRALGAMARQRAGEFTWSRAAQATEKLYRSLLAAPSELSAAPTGLSWSRSRTNTVIRSTWLR